MVADAEGARRWASWKTESARPPWIGLLANATLILAATGAGVGVLYLAQIFSSSNAAAAIIIIGGLAGVAGFAAFAARWVHGALAGRVDILSQALEASPDAQLIIGPDGRVAYANTAFDDLFPAAGE